MFSEKNIKYIPSGNEKFINIYGTFIPYFDEIKQEFRFNGKQIIQAKKIFEEIKAKKYDYYFMLGYDLDENGQFLSYIIKNELINIGVDKEKILRTPLTEKNYILLTDDIDMTPYIEYRKKDIRFIQKQREKNIKTPIGLLKAISLYYIQKYRNSVFKINTQGTSTFTFLLKFLKKV
jgi:5S rRNA maturation endonuclease (ribonuclease M5)